MATLQITAPASGAISTVFHRIIEGWRQQAVRRARADQVRRELNAYTDRELADLGLSRSDIPGIAHAAYNEA